MNRIWSVVALLVFPLTFVIQANAQTVSTEPVKAEIGEPKFSIGLGFGNGYKLKDENYSGMPNMDNSNVSSVRLGYNFSKYVGIEGERSKISGFIRKRYFSPGIINKLEIGAVAYNLNIKVGIPIKVKDGFVIKPYFVKSVVGKNTMTFVLDIKTDDYYSSESDKTTNSKIGGGIEIKLYKNLSLFWEASRWRWKFTEGYWSYSFVHSETVLGMIEKF
jgi:hypothetical protein